MHLIAFISMFFDLIYFNPNAYKNVVGTRTGKIYLKSPVGENGNRARIAIDAPKDTNIEIKRTKLKLLTFLRLSFQKSSIRDIRKKKIATSEVKFIYFATEGACLKSLNSNSPN